jgi:membrane-bound inhibitor of C-type lysozyme
MTFRKIVSYIVIIVFLVIIGYSVFHKTPAAVAPTPPVATKPISTANYSCDAGSTIAASFSTNSASLKLSDGRSLVLPQIISADGAQYQQGSILFVTKGDQAFLQENGNTTYSNCIAGAATTSTNGLKTFTDSGNTFTFNYPQDFVLAGGGIGYSENWKTNTDGTLGLVLATIDTPTNYLPKTNFGDAKFTVGTSSDPKAVASCLTNNSGLGGTTTTTTINGVKYTVIFTQDAGAGNRYDTTSYRTVQNGQCYAIEYTIHYAVLANYDPNSGVTDFGEAKVKATFDAIVQSLKFLPQ